ncbi:ABC transporter permease [uncultured Cohaesibacter sp.]|uniref:ABC transporter permease n=1 Tax=uncultured Cohaesibacter sp. TaxID=1002546 RepID=UPI002AA7D32C|nr:ABC transporter permease [uncultured Cohaesibacter sp.]
MTELIEKTPFTEPFDARGSNRLAGTRRQAVLSGLIALTLVLGVFAYSLMVSSDDLRVDPAARMLAPSLEHLFGTDLLGRDMLLRTLLALGQSIGIGLFAGIVSTALSVILGLLASVNRLADRIVGVATELFLGLPHFVLLMLVAYAAGGGVKGVILAVGLTHWPRLARLLRHETQRVLASDYVAVSRGLGRSPLWIAQRHLLPHLIPQIIAGFVLIFPHAILHEAGLSFLGLGVPPHLPSIGVILSESLRALGSGLWWLAFFPGLGLLLVALSFEIFGESLRRVSDPDEGVA